MYSLLKSFFCIQLYDISYSYLIQIICTELHGFKYSYLILIIHMVSSNYFYSIIIISLHSYIDRTLIVISTQVRVDLGVMERKDYSTLPTAMELKPHYQMQFDVIPRVLPFCRECSQHILRSTNRTLYLI